MSNLAKPSPPYLTRLPTRLALALAIPTPTPPLPFPHLPLPSSPLALHIINYVTPGGGGGGGGGTRDIYCWGCALAHPKRGGLRCGHSP